MMGWRNQGQARLFYEFCLDEVHLDWQREISADFCNTI